MDAAGIRDLIRSIPDFPIPGILFRDVTPLLRDREGLRAAIDLMAGPFAADRIDYIVAIEARGYILGAPLAYRLGAGFIPVRKPGKLPGETINVDYELEYGTNTLEVHSDALSQGHRVLIVDDLLATGGTAAATYSLLQTLGAHIVGFSFLIELEALGGRAKLSGSRTEALIRY
ncbi:MAG: adenine phosphoribosyltransferase [Candidatus Eremiobacteraeota bacterium]|nr:adenine phosphoribosyltransferase [Candidatus Eremiobacteraeota bacterium]MBC5827096.1 adenine phosphoribosyltransferase [Candidatus Eremiobacteraeota bacterium]